MAAKRKRLSWLYTNVGAKLAALALAFAVYFYAYSSEHVEQTITFPVELVGVPDSLVPNGEPPREVKVRVRGYGRELLGLRFGSVKVMINLSDVSAGRYFRPFAASDVVLPAGTGATVLEVVSPRALDLRFERTASKWVAVEPRIIGKPKPGWELVVPINVLPESVLVRGPLSVVDGTKSIAVKRVDVSDATDTVRSTVGLDLEAPSTVTVTPAVVEVIVPIEPRIEREFDGVPVKVLRSDAVKRVSVLPEYASVVISGPRTQVQRVRREDIIVNIDARRMDAGQFLIAPTVSATRRLRIESVQPDRFQVVLEPYPARERKAER